MQKFFRVDGPFLQQKMKAWRLKCNYINMLILFIILVLLSLLFTIISFIGNNNINIYRVEYNDKNEVSLKIDKDLTGKYYLYYELTNFYQNNFLYSSSKSWDMMTGSPLNKVSLSDCNPVTEKDNKTIAPCGSNAYSVFNDSFTFDGLSLTNDIVSNTRFVNMFKDLDSSYDDAYKFLSTGVYATQYTGGVGDPKFADWMQTGAFSTFRKNIGRITEQKIEKGSYSITINNNFNMTGLGKKSIILASANFHGGRNMFVSYFFLSVTILYLLSGIFVFFILQRNDIMRNKSVQNSKVGYDNNYELMELR